MIIPYHTQTVTGILNVFPRLMGRPGVDTKRSKAGQLWGVHHRSGRDSALDIGQTEYITRLTALRDSLIDQEQVGQMIKTGQSSSRFLIAARK